MDFAQEITQKVRKHICPNGQPHRLEEEEVYSRRTEQFLQLSSTCSPRLARRAKMGWHKVEQTVRATMQNRMELVDEDHIFHALLL